MNSYKYLPNCITVFRIIGTICLLFLEPFSSVFFVIYTLAGISDVLDGFFARKLKVTSTFGAKLDSVADLLYYAVMLIKIFPVMWVRLSKKIWIVVGTIVVARIASYAVAAVRLHHFASTHAYLNKLTGASIFAVPYIINLPIAGAFCWGICIIAGIAALRELRFHICCPKPQLCES